jgi:hypothetical protein
LHGPHQVAQKSTRANRPDFCATERPNSKSFNQFDWPHAKQEKLRKKLVKTKNSFIGATVITKKAIELARGVLTQFQFRENILLENRRKANDMQMLHDLEESLSQTQTSKSTFEKSQT